MSDILVVASKVKKIAKAKGYRMSADSLALLSLTVERIVEIGCEQAQAEGVQTVKARHLKQA